MPNIIYTIGHSSISVEELFDRLKQYNITALVDIRSVPYSRFVPRFNRESMQKLCHENSISYLFFGDSLGGRPLGSSAINYDYMCQQNYYLLGIDKLLSLIDTYCLCLMCAEGHPRKCHRNLLVGQTLEKRGMNILHILRDGQTMTSAEVGKKCSKK